MAYVVYVDDRATWKSASLEQAQALAAPYVRDRRALRIEVQEQGGDSRAWAFDYNADAWVEQSSTDGTDAAR